MIINVREHVKRALWLLSAALVVCLLVALVFVLRSCQHRLETERHFVAGQVLVTGPTGDQITEVIRNTRGFLDMEEEDLKLVERLEFKFEIPKTCEGLTSVSMEDGRVLFVIDQYQITGTVPLRVTDEWAIEEIQRKVTVKQVIQAIRNQARLREIAVSPEPNYVTGRPPVTMESDPWSGEGSPWSGEGSPWSGEGSPSGTQIANAANQEFRKQWALNEDNGISLMDDQGERLIDDVTGSGVRVGVFDTSPFPVTVASAVFPMTRPLTLTLAHPVTGDRLNPDTDAPDIRDHGLFVAGLVHAVAPESEIQLIRVLDNTGQGDLHTLNKALQTFISETLTISDTLKGSLIHLSLGVHPPPDAEEQDLPDEVVSLQNILAAARCLDFVVVAAAGNESAESAQRPARWDSTLGVAASNISKTLACFSNAGEVAAPGGDGEQPGCKRAIDQCARIEETRAADGGCPIALLSLSLVSNTGYAYWNGTSFSAPLVSGLAALILEAEGDAISADEIYAEIKDGAISGENVINVPYTLQ